MNERRTSPRSSSAPRWDPFRPVDGASLGLFRVAFGLLMLWEVGRYVRNGWIVSVYVAPVFHFHWPGFEWLRPWPGAGMHLHFLVLAIAAACLAVGRGTRLAAGLLAVGWAYVQLLERTEYLNHLYLACLLACLFACVPSDRAFRFGHRPRSAERPETVPAWALWLLRFQIAIPYVYGAFAKLNGDFLRGEPLWLWTSRMHHLRGWVPGLGSLQLALAASWLAFAFDLLAVPLLLWRRTRPWAFATAVAFHLANAVMFRIGIFPWMMIAATTLFLEPDWPRRVARRWRSEMRSSAPDVPSARPATAHRPLVLGLITVWVAVQLLVPFRHVLIPGRVDWTSEGYHFSWRMMLNDQASAMRIVATDPTTGRSFPVDPRTLGLTYRQVEKLGQDPELLRQFAHYARHELAWHEPANLEVRATVLSSLNGRRPQYLVDPTVDLASLEPTRWHADWIVPLTEPLPIEPWLEPPATWERAVGPWRGTRAKAAAGPSSRGSIAKSSGEPSGPRPRIRFVEATETGVDFVYFEGPDETTRGVRQFEQTGGGVAVLDVDGDEWPDLYLPQGAQWPHGATRPLPTDRFNDRLYRNVGGTFEDVTNLAGLGSRDFGQGAAVGDVDGDSFPDLYVANVGRNRLYLNNGDGTFTEAEDFAGGDTNDDWTTSVAIVDLDDDGLPDLFDVNYLTGENVYTVICNGHACSPHGFDGVPDRLRLNRGDGTFETVPDATPRENGKGLGIVAFAIDDPRRPALFIANDQVANHLLRNRPASGRFDVRLDEEGLLRGLSFDGDGRAMACMGVAADDADGDGRLDLFVTNFARESNTLYLQDADGLFADRTRRAGLERPSLEYVGWGTQFVDADLDGAPDLVLANGHVDDYRDEGGGYRMPPQFFRNRGDGAFEELAAEEVGPFFAHESLGRGLATLDWQRDGLIDFAISRIGERTALVANRTENPGRFLHVRLHAVCTARDAIGARVTVTEGGHERSRQLTAGDGYMASNERLLSFGLGHVDGVERVVVKWPSGGRTVIEHPPTDVTLELVEDSPDGVLWRGTQPESLHVEVPDRQE